MIQTLVSILGPTDVALLAGGILVLFVVMLLAFRGPGWFGRALSFAGGWLVCIAVLAVGKRLRPPQWTPTDLRPEDLVDPGGPTVDHPERTRAVK